jgi:transposase
MVDPQPTPMTVKPCSRSVQGIPPIRARRGPRRRRPTKLHADKGYDYPPLRRWLRTRAITPRIARRGIENSTHLGRHRWVVERTIAWLTGCRRLHRRYERKPDHFLAFTALAAALIAVPNEDD